MPILQKILLNLILYLKLIRKHLCYREEKYKYQLFHAELHKIYLLYCLILKKYFYKLLEKLIIEKIIYEFRKWFRFFENIHISYTMRIQIIII